MGKYVLRYLFPFTTVCCRYHVEPFSPEETTVYGVHGIKLVPYDKGRRCWWMLAEDPAQQLEWMNVRGQ